MKKPLFLLSLPLLALAGCGGGTPTISKAELAKITKGMTYAQVKKIVGGPGKQISRIKLVADANTTVTDVTYEWKVQSGPKMHFMFFQDHLVASSSEPIPNPAHKERGQKLAAQFEKDIAQAKTQAELDRIVQYYNYFLIAGSQNFPEVVLTADHYIKPVRGKAMALRATLPAGAAPAAATTPAPAK